MVRRLNAVALPLALIILGLTGCGGGFPNPKTTPSNVSVKISVNPSLITVAAGSTTTFTASFTPSPPRGGSLTWSVNPANGGTVTNAGVYTASATAGNYTVDATWTPSIPPGGASARGSATVKVLPVPQLGAELNTDLVQASGGIQVFSAVQNAAVVGQSVPSATSTDPTGNVQNRSGFTIPVCESGPCP